ncbi:MAG: hypothetical protein BWK80_48750 [Desulfobacteraceae bacterium IS3]|nr:MAG: hypothetical protein BWK80_48750 [Desulfobacteraceae bacterium IS3]
MEKAFEKFVIHRFRGLRDIELSNLGRINLLVGPNNSGKTSVLEAISAYCRPLDPLEWLSTAWRREIKSSRIPMMDALKWLFPQAAGGDLEYLYKGKVRLSATGTFQIFEVSADYREISGIEDVGESDSEIGSIDGDIIRRGAELTLKASADNPLLGFEQLSQNFQIWENERFVKRRTSKEYTLPVTTITPFSHRVEPLQVKLFTDAAFQQVTDYVMYIAKQLDSDINGIQILDKTGMRSGVYIEHAKTGLSPISVFGDGLRRTLTIALNLPLVRDGILLIDEIETSIHTSALKTVFQWLANSCEKLNVQLFATTHSIEAIDAILSVDKEIKKDLAAYRLPSPETDGKVKRFGDDLLYRLRHERGMDVR